MLGVSDSSGAPFAIRFLNGELESDGLPIPSALQLKILVVLALNSNRTVSGETLVNHVYEEPPYNGMEALRSPLSRLRKQGWPIATRTLRLDLPPASIDILHFDAKAKDFILRAQGAQHLSSAELAELRRVGESLDALWAADPSEPFKDSPALVRAFGPYLARHDRFRASYDSLFGADQSPGAPAPLPATSQYRSPYLRDVMLRGFSLTFGNPNSWTDADSAQDMITLADLWTPLRAADSRHRSGNRGTHESMAERDSGVDLMEAVASSDDDLMILGEPGSGKSTSMSMLAVSAARRAISSEGPLPIWVSLGAVAPSARLTPERVLLTGVPELAQLVARSGENAAADLASHLESELLGGRALLLLDGLDEVKEHVLEAVRAAVARIVQLKSGSRILTTCRSFDYRHSQPSRRLPILRELDILPLTSEQQDLYIDRWYEAAVRSGGFQANLARGLAEAIKSELRRTPDIAEMASSPLLLALLTLIHSRQELPDSRSVVCDQAIKFLLSETPPWRGREPGSSVEATGPVIRVAVEVAHRHHSNEETEIATEAGIPHQLVMDVAVEIVAALKRAGAGHAVPASEALARQFENSNGLVIESSPGHYKFSHRYFQEYLAGQHYARGPGRAEALNRAGSIHWREPFRLMASLAGHEGQNLYYVLTLIQDFHTSSSVEAQHLAAEMLCDITRPRLALWGYEDVIDEHGTEPSLWRQMQITATSHAEDQALPLPFRSRAADIAAALGDLRFTSSDGTSERLEIPSVLVPHGPFHVGTLRVDPETVPGGFVGEPRLLDFSDYRISKYAVTNSQFEAFVTTGGYSDATLWRSPRALGWVTGDADVLREIRRHWLETVYEHHAKEIRDREIDPERLEHEAERRTAPRAAPFYWYDGRFHCPNQPVVGVNYWEAEAYCEWATRRGRAEGTLTANEAIVIPSEFEWERASRPKDDDRIFPWGDEWNDLLAHTTTNTLNLRQPTAVGIYPPYWPDSPLDMAGNVWEWTSSLFLPYDDSYDSRRCDSDSLDERVVRGCSWYHFAPLAACSVRAVDRSYNLFYDVGFRVAIIDIRSPRPGLV